MKNKIHEYIVVFFALIIAAGIFWIGVWFGKIGSEFCAFNAENVRCIDSLHKKLDSVQVENLKLKIAVLEKRTKQ